METERFEDKIKRQMLDREITPSAGSWDKLSASLDVQEKKKKPFVLWMGIAASIISGILVLSLVFNNSNPSALPQIVNTPKEEVKIEKAPIETSEEIFAETIKEEQQVAVSEEKRESINPGINKNSALENPIQQNNREAVAAIDNSSILNDKSAAEKNLASDNEILNLKLNNALNHVIAQTIKENVVTDAEVDRLLEEAAKKISQERYSKNYATGKVDPQDLLLDAEFELDNSFRDKIFDLLKEGYSKAKTAVANRNY
tara:strand:+ start:26638 stop:27411 length:774 start_codon:yes stop_codon:yes gene_type:complete